MSSSDFGNAVHARTFASVKAVTQGRTTMGRLVVVSISSFCFALVASVGLAAYTAARPEAAGAATVSGPEGQAPFQKIVG
jgi:hypothetical protein